MLPVFALVGLACLGLIWFLIARSRGRRLTMVEMAGACGAITLISAVIVGVGPLLQWLEVITDDQAYGHGLLTLPLACGCIPVGVFLTIILSILAAVQQIRSRQQASRDIPGEGDLPTTESLQEKRH